MTSEITCEFLQTLVKAPVATFRTQEASTENDNAAGALVSIICENETGQTVCTLIHKTIPVHPHSRMWVMESRVFWVENAMYADIFPRIQTLSSTLGCEYKPPVPNYYGGSVSDQDDFITLEDLRPEGFKIANKFKGLNEQQVTLVMQELGKFHAATRALLDAEEEELRQRHPYIKVDRIFQDREKTSMILQGSVGFMLQLISKQKPELGERISEAVKKAGGPFEIFVKLSDPGGETLKTILHGDLWTNNILFKYDTEEEDEPTGVKFIDFQLSSIGCVCHDILYFFYCSTTPALRKDSFDKLLRVYHDNLFVMADKLRVRLPEGMQWDSFRAKIEEMRLAAFLMMMFALPFQLGVKLPFNQSEENGKSDEVANPEELHAKFFKQLQDCFISSPLGQERLMQLVDELVELKLV